MKTRVVSGLTLLALGVWMLGCETAAGRGALIGGGAGALAGQAIGHSTKGTVIGAATGAVAGAIIGHQIDQSRAARQQPPQPVVVEQAPQPIVVTQPPPSVLVEQRPSYPGAGYVWVEGYWVWNGANYAWQPGYWVMPPQPSVIWIQPRYERHGGGYHYWPGYWHRR